MARVLNGSIISEKESLSTKIRSSTTSNDPNQLGDRFEPIDGAKYRIARKMAFAVCLGHNQLGLTSSLLRIDERPLSNQEAAAAV